jgi:hypothetical protein
MSVRGAHSMKKQREKKSFRDSNRGEGHYYLSRLVSDEEFCKNLNVLIAYGQIVDVSLKKFNSPYYS